ncbi:BON domain-containing protein [Ancylobacter sp. MQZ15Z-1]|uniref:BON domain-containing protein n=1 Tax=Ancylobacter mangrovi TaxID=2972472 RepID=A0A9X2PKN6_9HYPH|nr:BON domain-containing protein [Ancylobacter mangrovi]MCS0495703.1 BON domain-containing protein [Ancylobacter mangrovi]
MSERMLQERAADALRRDGRIDASRISVAAKGGVVTLSGRVGSYAEKAIAARIVTALPGVRHVEEDLGIACRRPSPSVDHAIALRARVRLLRSPTFPGGIEVTVRNGRVTLKGCVANWHQAALAEAAVEDIRGVTGVDNLLTIGSAPANGPQPRPASRMH